MSVIQDTSRPSDHHTDPGAAAGASLPAPRAQPPTGEPSRPAIERQAAGFFGLPHGSHVCLVYERSSEARSAVVAFFAAGLAAGERCLYLGGSASWRRIERALTASYLPAGAGSRRAAGALGEVERPRRAGDPREWRDLVREAERQALADGFSGLRLSWEMPPDPDPARRPEMAEMEALLERYLPGGHTSLLCRYSRQRTPAALLHQAMRRHPAAMLGGEIGANAFYEPPRVEPGALPSEERVGRMLAQLRHELRCKRQLQNRERRLAEMEAELERAGHDREQLIAMLAHELRNPLSTVSVALQVLRLRGAGGQADETWKRALDAAERQVFHQAALVDDLLEASRVTRGKIDLQREPLDLARLVPDVVDAYRDDLREAGLGLDLEMPHESLPVLGDRLRLWQAVAHLLQNAVKFSPRGGRVKVGLGRAAGARAAIVVRDSGIGISQELLPHVFDVFTQADHTLDRAQGGLGLGLAVVKGVIELHGGEVEARSEGQTGKGSEFKLLLPLAAASAGEDSPAADAQPPAPPDETARRVLVIEDNPDTAAILRDLLELSGYEVETAPSGGEGVDRARRFHPEIVLCDLGLPGMNGFEVASALRHDPQTAAARLIALTGYGGDEDRRRSREAGFDLHLTKPVDPAMLRRLLSSPAVRRRDRPQ
jgi:signal transduction histidine kinase/ActR/RegA family two-component response regulator